MISHSNKVGLQDKMYQIKQRQGKNAHINQNLPLKSFTANNSSTAHKINKKTIRFYIVGNAFIFNVQIFAQLHKY